MRPQNLAFCYHKTGTVLFQRVFARVGARLGLRFETGYGLVETMPVAPELIVLAHSLLGKPMARPFRGVRVVRDPRDIWVSSYLYHLRCDEPWCLESGGDTSAPILFPRVPIAMQHRRERFKRDYLARLGGQSYQANLQGRDLAAGLDFELAGYTGLTLEAMAAWSFDGPEVIELKLETIMADFDASMARIFRHFGFTEAETAIAVQEAAAEDLARQDDAVVAANPHIHSRRISKWRDMLTPAQVRAFEGRYAALISRLGYALTASPVTP